MAARTARTARQLVSLRTRTPAHWLGAPPVRCWCTLVYIPLRAVFLSDWIQITMCLTRYKVCFTTHLGTRTRVSFACRSPKRVVFGRARRSRMPPSTYTTNRLSCARKRRKTSYDHVSRRRVRRPARKDYGKTLTLRSLELKTSMIVKRICCSSRNFFGTAVVLDLQQWTRCHTYSLTTLTLPFN